MILDGEAVVLDEKRLPTDLFYVGHAGAGFFRKVARDLKCNWISRIEKPPAHGINGKKYVFVQPTLVAESPGPMTVNCAMHRCEGDA